MMIINNKNMDVLNKDMYPTPIEVLMQMDFDPTNKVILEPSAGTGNIIDYLKLNGAKQVLACEKSEKLASIVKDRCDVFLENDFLEVTREQVSHIQMIIANPPFSCGIDHILHMWEIAPDGCEIVTLLNYDNVDPYERYGHTRKSRELMQIVNTYGSLQNLGQCFSTAERPTNVNVGMIKLFRPASEQSGFEGFYMDDTHEVNTLSGLVTPNAIRDLVDRYVDSLNTYKEFEAVQNKMNSVLKCVNVQPLKASLYDEKSELNYDTFASGMQKVFWKHMFRIMNLDRFFTSQVKERINQFSEQQQKVPFTMKNIYKMVEIIHATKDELLNTALVEAVDNFTRHTHENRYEVAGWKTNDSHMLGMKFIVDYAVECRWSENYSMSYGGNRDKLDDLIRILCNLTGNDFNKVESSFEWIKKGDKTNEWYTVKIKELDGKNENGQDKFILKPIFFEFKFFKKGTIHIKFLDRDVWATLNRAYAKIKGEVLPEKL